MASKMLGRALCPECSFASAHVKISTDKDTAKPYRHCPECGAQYFPKNKDQGDMLLAKMQPSKIDSEAPGAPGRAPTPVTRDADAQPAAPGYKVVLGCKVPA